MKANKVVEEKPREKKPEPLDAPADTPYADMSDRQLLRKLKHYTEEWQMLATDQSAAAVTRRVELARLMFQIRDVQQLREPLVEVTVPASVTGEPFCIGPNTFHPGVHRVRASVAQYLLWLIGENQRIELNRLKSNGRTIDLGFIGNRARLARIARDDGSDDYQGRGTGG
jgi:hypothetical protein